MQEINFKSPKIVYGWGSAPHPAGGAHDAPPNPLIGFIQALHALDSRAKKDANMMQVINFKSPKIVYGRGSAPDPAGGAYDAPPDP